MLVSKARIILHFSNLCTYFFLENINTNLTFAVNAILNISNGTGMDLDTIQEPETGATQEMEGRKNFDVVVYSVGSALMAVIILAFLRGFYRLKLDRKRPEDVVTPVEL